MSTQNGGAGDLVLIDCWNEDRNLTDSDFIEKLATERVPLLLEKRWPISAQTMYIIKGRLGKCIYGESDLNSEMPHGELNDLRRVVTARAQELLDAHHRNKKFWNTDPLDSLQLVAGDTKSPSLLDVLSLYSWLIMSSRTINRNTNNTLEIQLKNALRAFFYATQKNTLGRHDHLIKKNLQNFQDLCNLYGLMLHANAQNNGAIGPATKEDFRRFASFPGSLFGEGNEHGQITKFPETDLTLPNLPSILSGYSAALQIISQRPSYIPFNTSGYLIFRLGVMLNQIVPDHVTGTTGRGDHDERGFNEFGECISGS